MNKRHKIATYCCCLFLGIVTMLLIPLNVQAEPDYGKEIIMVSMGDSYSSGEGIEDFYGQEQPLELKVEDPDWLAHRSQKSWSGQLKLSGLDKNMEAYKSMATPLSISNNGKWYFVAASGAETKHFEIEEQNKEYNKVLGYSYQNKKGRGTRTKAYIHNNQNLPKQLDIFDNITEGEVDYVTLSLGGNDAGFVSIITACALGVSYSNVNNLSNKLQMTWDDFYKVPDGIRYNLANVYSSIERKAGKQAEIIIAGYPKLLDQSGKGILFSKEEADIVNKNVSRFNNEIERLVNSFESETMHFVSVEDAFNGHEAYSKEPFINEVMIPAQKQDLNDDDFISAYSIHPNEEGAKRYKDCVQKKIEWIEKGKQVTVTGKVVDRNGNPVPNLSIMITDSLSGNNIFSGTTDSNGIFAGNADNEVVLKSLVEFSDDSGIVLRKQQALIKISEGDKILLETKLNKIIKREDNDLGTFELSDYETVVDIKDHESIDKEQEINSILNDFVRQRDVLYGKTCTFTLTRGGDGNNTFESRWEGLSEGMILGYSIEDFDNDERSELLLITLVEDYRLQLEMYEVVNNEVVLADRKYPDTDSSYGAVQIPCGRDYESGLCGLLSCFVDDTNHKIFIQSSDAVHNLGEGNETYITSMIYENNSFSDYRISHEIGSSVEDGIPDRVKELSDMGVPNIDYDVYDRVFYNLAPLIECFDGGVHEIIRAEQYTTEVEKENSLTTKIVTETVFATQDGVIENPVVETGIGADEILSVYQIYNEFFAEGYRSVIEYRPAEWALADLDDDGVPEIIFTQASSNREGIFEVFYYNEQNGMVESAGSFTTEYYEAVRCCPDKHLLSTDASKAGFWHWEGYSYNDHSIGWSFDLSAMTDPGSNPRTYNLSVTDENGRQDLGKYEIDDCNRIWDEYFGEQNEIEFQYFPTGNTWNLPEGPAMHGE